MSSSNQAKSQEMNEKMVKFAPELASEYAKWPLRREAWVALSGTVDGKPCFCVASASTPAAGSMKLDYVYGKGPSGNGYYHLLNPHAYKNLYERLSSEAPPGACVCAGKAARQNYSDYDDVKTIVYRRAVATRPDDTQAAKDAEAIAKAKAQGTYNATQNEQLVLHAVFAAT